jgi:hypothetical protein
VFFAKFLPGWMFNVATLVHGEEALLAVGFIFHHPLLQHGHLPAGEVPDGYPSIFTGRIPEHELKHERGGRVRATRA